MSVHAGDTHTRAVGVLGAGLMGIGIIGNLVRAGFQVNVYDPDTSKVAEVNERGARFAANPAEVVQRSRYVLLVVASEAQVSDLLLDGERLLETADPETVFIVISTIATELVQSLAAEAQRHACVVIDAPVSGSGAVAEKGELLSLVGGPEEVVVAAMPVFAAYSTEVVRLGPAGAGQVAKAVTNLIMRILQVASHEGLALAQRYELDIDALIPVLMQTSAANAALANWGKHAMTWAEHDLGTATDLAIAKGISLPVTGVTREVCRTLAPRLYSLEQYGV